MPQSNISLPTTGSWGNPTYNYPLKIKIHKPSTKTFKRKKDINQDYAQ